MLGMPAGRFLVYNVIGGVLWADGILLAGYLSARKLRDTVGAANIDKYLLPAIAVIVIVSVIPIFVEVLRNRRQRRRDPATADAAADSRPVGTGDAPVERNAPVDTDTHAARAGEPRQ
jgi:membrane-associated protein